MKTRIFLLTFLAFSTFTVFGQKKTRNFDFRVGSGVSLLGFGDIIASNYENELNYFMNNYLSSSVSILFGKSDLGIPIYSSFSQANVNLYIHPFRNNRIVDFRIGTGLSYINISYSYISDEYVTNEGLFVTNYVYDHRKSFGTNIILENTYRLGNHILMGLKLFSQTYFNKKESNSGALIKLGYTF